jgi:alkylhydroperoxidase/carboxymuconolactone decarboxylase family protein YurZ
MQITRDVAAEMRKLRADALEVMHAFASLARVTLGGKALDRKTRELRACQKITESTCD